MARTLAAVTVCGLLLALLPLASASHECEDQNDCCADNPWCADRTPDEIAVSYANKLIEVGDGMNSRAANLSRAALGPDCTWQVNSTLGSESRVSPEAGCRQIRFVVRTGPHGQLEVDPRVEPPEAGCDGHVPPAQCRTNDPWSVEVGIVWWQDEELVLSCTLRLSDESVR